MHQRGMTSDGYLPSVHQDGGGLAGLLPRGIARLTDDQHFDGAIRAARIEAAGEVTAEALKQLGALVEMEEDLRRMHPLAAGRAELLINQFTRAAAAEIVDMGRSL